jgi:murein DD-endopeptidase MepM/ murein hydrolase activator NlpD
MTYTVKSGDTLSEIAQAHGITLAQLLDANPQHKAHPNLIHVGDVLNIPSGQTAPVAPPVVPTPQPQPVAGGILGKLSERFEVGGRGPGTVSTGQGDQGGVSYGSYQMTSRPNGGTVARFVSQPAFPFHDRFSNLSPGSSEFSAVWRQIADTQRDEFQRIQHDFIKKTHFDLLVQKIMRDDGLDIRTRSHALQDVIWSTAVQHGPNNNIVHQAIGTLQLPHEDPQFDRSLIIAIYTERGRKNPNGTLVHFSRNSPAVQRGVAQRFIDEQRDALNMLAAEVPG